MTRNRKKENLLWLLYAGVLVLLFLASSTDLIIKERKSEVYPISVIIEDSVDDNYVNFRKGMDQAAAELNADVSFITLYDKNDADQQLELISREQQDGARALIVSPVNEKTMTLALAEKRVTVPLVLLNSELAADQISAVITPDYDRMGRQLAAQIAADHDRSIPVYLFGSRDRNDMAGRFESGVRAGLEESGFKVILCEKQGEGDYRKTIEGLVYPGGQNVIIVALEPESLRETARILADSTVYASCVEGLYGRGTNLSLLNELDSGVISSLCVTDDFSAGYQSVKKAVEIITAGSYQQEPVVQESFCIQKQDLRKQEFERMLYPIE